MAQVNPEAQRNKESNEQQAPPYLRNIMDQLASMSERLKQMEIKEAKAQGSSHKEASTSNAKGDSNPREEGPYHQYTNGLEEEGELDGEVETNGFDNMFDRRMDPRQPRWREPPHSPIHPEHWRPIRPEYPMGPPRRNIRQEDWREPHPRHNREDDYQQWDYPPPRRGEGQIGSL